MLNLVRQNELLVKNKKFNGDKKIKTSKHFPSSTREWKNSIYVYNKDNLNLIPNTGFSAINIIKSYFSLFNKNIEKKITTQRLRLKFRRFSSNKIYISNGEFKHTNNKVIINLYLFNRQKINYKLAINKQEENLIISLKQIHNFLFKRLKLEKKKGLLKTESKLKEKLKLKKKLKKQINLKKIYLIQKYISLWNNKKYINNYISVYIDKFLEKYINITQSKLLLYWYYKQLIKINNSKYTYTYLQYLKEQLYKIYNKEIEFNLIDLKRFYLNSDILSESILKKITINRKRMKHHLRRLKNKIRIKRNISILHKHMIKNKLEEKKNLTRNKKKLKKTIIKNLKYKKITGFRIEAQGRLTRRYTASRSRSKLIYQGNLLNIDSSIKGLSTVLLKGNLKSNVQYTKLASKTRIGSFGLKGWVGAN